MPLDFMDDVEDQVPPSLRQKNIWSGKLNGLFKNIMLVRNNSNAEVRFDSLQGKYLVILCMPVPLPANSSRAERCHALIDSYVSLTTTYHENIDIEMVLVVNMRKGYENDKNAFDHFFSAFPCLAIPFSHSRVRAKICSSIGMFQAIVVNPEGCILMHPNTLEYFKRFGSDWAHSFTSDGNVYFPFLENTMNAILEKDEELRARLDPMYGCVNDGTPGPTFASNPLSLVDILECDSSSDFYRYDCRSVFMMDSNNSSVKDLSQKYVGLYLCSDGQFMEQVKAVYDNCLSKKQELEIVVVCSPLLDDPKSYYEDLIEALQFCKIKSWFLFEPNREALRRIWRIYGQSYNFEGDRFIIVPPNGGFGDLSGRVVVTRLGIDIYPFTRSSILKQRLEYLRSLTLGKIFYEAELVRNGSTFELNMLEGKNLLLYLDYLEDAHNNKQLYNLMIQNYSKISGLGWEVLFVPRDVQVPSYLLKKLDNMPWPYTPHPASFNVAGRLTLPEDKDLHFDFLIGVGEGGMILSRHIDDELESALTEGRFPSDTLEEELAIVLFRLADDCDEY